MYRQGIGQVSTKYCAGAHFRFCFVNASMPKVGGLRSSKHVNFVLRVYRSLWAASSSVIDVVRDALLCL